MTAKISASSDGLKVTIGNSAEDALEINQTAKTIAGINGYSLAGNGPAFSAEATGVQSVTSGVTTKVNLPQVNFDTHGCFANSRFTPTIAGYYQINVAIQGNATNAVSVVGTMQAHINKSGVDFRVSTVSGEGLSSAMPSGSELVYMNGTTDYVEARGLVTGGSPTFGYSSGVRCTMSGFLARAA